METLPLPPGWQLLTHKRHAKLPEGCDIARHAAREARSRLCDEWYSADLRNLAPLNTVEDAAVPPSAVLPGFSGLMSLTSCSR